jgi:hypothetical protein
MKLFDIDGNLVALAIAYQYYLGDVDQYPFIAVVDEGPNDWAYVTGIATEGDMTGTYLINKSRLIKPVGKKDLSLYMNNEFKTEEFLNLFK